MSRFSAAAVFALRLTTSEKEQYGKENHMSYARKISIGLAVLSIAAVAEAQKPIVYPAKGQTTQQQSKDDAECYAWARQTTGIDPAVVASSPPPQETGPAVGGGQRLRGAVRGAAGGGAGVGAVVGTMAGGRQARQQQAARNQQAVSQQQEMINTFYRAFGACMEGRGYTIK
jgi:hypothetical protein